MQLILLLIININLSAALPVYPPAHEIIIALPHFCTVRLQYILCTYTYYEDEDDDQDEDNEDKQWQQ